MEQSRKEILPGVFLTCLKTEKFKTGLISLNLLTPLTRQDAAMLPKGEKLAEKLHLR